MPSSPFRIRQEPGAQGRAPLVFAAILVFTALLVGLLASYSGKPGAGASEPQIADLLQHVQLPEGYSALAVMFSSETCPTCNRMLPYWRQLEEAPPQGVMVVHINYDAATAALFAKYGVTETPTYVVLDSGGRILARYTGPFTGSNITRSMYDWIVNAASSVEGGEPKPHLYSLVAYPVLGAMLALSPCVTPVLALYAGIGSSGRKTSHCLACGLASFAGILVLGGVVVVATSLAAKMVPGLLMAMAVAAILFGAYSLQGASPMAGFGRLASAGLPAACFGFGLVVLQCSLPLLGGTLALAASTGNLSVGLAGVALLALGLSTVLTLLLYAATRASGLVARLTGNPALVERVGGAILVVAGIYLMVSGW